MSELIKENETIFNTAFEPKVDSRFICFLTRKDGNPFLPSFVIKRISRPSGQRVDNKWVWEYMSMTVYDPIVPSSAQSVYSNIIADVPEFDINLKILGPVGDTIEEWEIKDAVIVNSNFGILDWSNSNDRERGDALEIRLLIKCSNVKLLY
jgi:hypothetical protein